MDCGATTLTKSAVLTRPGPPGRGRALGWCLMLTLAALAAGGCGPTWYLDPGFAERLAREQNKPMLVYFKAWDSNQHRDMKITVFEHPDVKRDLMDTVNVELEFAYFPDIAGRYGVQRPQVCVMCSPIGQKVHTALYANPVPTGQEFHEWLLKAKSMALPMTAPGPTTTAPAREGPAAGPP